MASGPYSGPVSPTEWKMTFPALVMLAATSGSTADRGSVSSRFVSAGGGSYRTYTLFVFTGSAYWRRGLCVARAMVVIAANIRRPDTAQQSRIVTWSGTFL